MEHQEARWQEGDQARRREEKCLWGLEEDRRSQGWVKGIHFSLFPGLRGGFEILGVKVGEREIKESKAAFVTTWRQWLSQSGLETRVAVRLVMVMVARKRE